MTLAGGPRHRCHGIAATSPAAHEPCSLRSTGVSAPDDLEQLSTEELRERAFSRAQDTHDVKFFWDVLTHTKGAAGVGAEDASSGAIFETISEGVAAVRQAFGHRDGDLDPMLRARYLEYLREGRVV